MAMLRNDEKRALSPLWTLCLLALLASACGSDSTPVDRGDNTEEDKSPAKGDDDDDDSAKADDDDEDAVIDAGTGTKKDAAIDARTTTPSMMKDARVVTTTDSGGGDPVVLPDSSTSAPDAGALIPKREDLGKGDGKDVITIGDSWMSQIFTGIQQSLVKVSGQPYRTYGVPGTRLLDEVIPNQFTSAKRADADIKTVVMTGGGNDILQTGLTDACANGTPECQEVLDKIGARLSSLWAQMSKDGVMDVIHIQYSRDAGKGTKNADDNDKKLQEACDAVPPPMRCHLLPTTDIVMGDLPDDIHPSAAGNDRIAKAVFDLMVKEGMRR